MPVCEIFLIKLYFKATPKFSFPPPKDPVSDTTLPNHEELICPDVVVQRIRKLEYCSIVVKFNKNAYQKIVSFLKIRGINHLLNIMENVL
jgi:hypothetical protein